MVKLSQFTTIIKLETNMGSTKVFKEIFIVC